tara:strand:+ start:947 stop:1735 length:789 start_codon:yes stop_codon:yes gene_type:complete
MPNIKTDTWPHNVSVTGDKKTIFDWTVATIYSDTDKWGKYKVSFEEDTTRETGNDGNEYRPFWELKGDWPEESGGRPLDYAGEQYPRGTVVKVRLCTRSYINKDGVQVEVREIEPPKKNRDGSISERNIQVYGGQPEQTPAEESQEEYPIRPVPTEGYVDKWDLKDINIRKAQALNLLTEVLTSGDKVNAPKIVKAIGFTDAAEAIAAVANGWNSLRRGLPIEFPVAVSDMEEEVAEESPMVEAAVEAGAVKQDENVELLKW